MNVTVNSTDSGFVVIDAGGPVGLTVRFVLRPGEAEALAEMLNVKAAEARASAPLVALASTIPPPPRSRD
jgi:uncharacterized linocin/CFP29 family protein